MNELKAYLLCRVADQNRTYTSWLNQSPLPTVVVDEYMPDWNVPDDAGILITHLHYRWEELTTLRRIHQQNRVPVLILCDGILEYRNTWLHPELVEGSLFQPVFGHKISCLGRAPARILESWGNGGKCEIVGLPRLDSALAIPAPPIRTTGPFRLLVATATTPAFDEQQREVVIDSLRQLQSKLHQLPTIQGRPVEVHWRLSAGLEQSLGFDEVDSENRPPLSEIIDQVDAVITTPSTMYLESVLRNRPTALLDFHNCPQYLSAAWVVSAERHLDAVLSELANPPAPKMLFQRTMLQDQLECQTPAIPRLVRLIESMVEERQRSLRTLQPLHFPARILHDPSPGFIGAPLEFELVKLYPNNPAFEHQDLQRLQIELAAAVKRLESLPAELAEKNRYLTQLNRAADRSRVRIEDMHNRVVALRKRFGVESESETD